MKNLKLFAAALAMFFMLGTASSVSASGWPMLMGVSDGSDTDFVLVKFDQNQFSASQAESLSQLFMSMMQLFSVSDLGYSVQAYTPNQLAEMNLGDADVVKWAMGDLGWGYIFVDFTQKQAPVSSITNYNMDVFYHEAGEAQDTYMMSVGFPNYWLSYFMVN
ncbi:MAG: hypothetical protein ACOCPN_04400 [Desulfonatronovibrionaceae bacterium]